MIRAVNELEKGRNVREVIRCLEVLRSSGSLVDGVRMDNGGYLRVEKNYLGVELPPDMPEHKSDNRILKVCKGLNMQRTQRKEYKRSGPYHERYSSSH